MEREVGKRNLGLRVILISALMALALGGFGGVNRDEAHSAEAFGRITPLWEPLWSPTMLFPGRAGYPDAVQALGTGDFNGDHRAELIALGSMIHLLSWTDEGLEEQLLPQLETEGKQGLVVADLNKDEKLDLVVAGSGGQVWVLLGDGRGGFQLAAGSPLILEDMQYIRALVSGDFSSDGIPDIAIASYDADRAYLLVGDGLGGFSQVSRLTGAEGKTWALEAFDLYGDGRMGVLLLTDEGLWFFPQSSIEGRLVREGLAGQALAIADFTSDGNPDLAIGQGDTLVLLAGLGGGNFSEAGRWEGDFPILWLIAADFRGEGRPDLVAGSFSSDIAVLAVDPSGSLSGPARYGFLDLNGLPRQSLSALATDLSGDGRAELIVRLGPWGALGVLTPTPMGRSLQRMAGAFLLAALDWDEDGSPDLLSDSLEGGLSVLINNGHGVFRSQELPFSTPLRPWEQPTPYLAREADLDGDGDRDLVIWSFQSSLSYPASVTTLVRERNSLELGWHRLIAGEVRPLLAVADLTGDGLPEVVTAAGEEVIVWRGVTGTPEELHRSWGGPVGPLVAVELSEGPGLVAGFRVPPADRPELVFLKGLNVEPTGIFVELAPLDLAAADLDGDGLQDLVAIGLHSMTDPAGQVSLEVALVVFWSDAAGGFTPEIFPIPNWPADALPFPYGGLAVGDFDGDGLPDLAVMRLKGSEGRPGGIMVLPNKGAKFGQSTLLEPCAGMRLLSGDFDGDGRAEFATSTLSTPIFLCLTAWR